MNRAINRMGTVLIVVLSFVWGNQAHSVVNEYQGIYMMDPDSIYKAPGWENPELPATRVGDLDQWILDYLKWSYVISGTVQKKVRPAGGGNRVSETAEDAFTAAVTALAVMEEKYAGNPTGLSKRLYSTLSGKPAGPFMKKQWEWFANEIDFELNQTGYQKEAWIARFVAGKKFEAENGKEYAALQTERVAYRSKWSETLDEDHVKDAHFNHKERQRINALADDKFRFVTAEVSTNPTATSAEAQSAWEAIEEKLIAYPHFRPEVLIAMDEQLEHPDHQASEAEPTLNQIYVDSTTAVTEYVALGSRVKKATIGFNMYAIIPASIESVLAIYQSRNGLPIHVDGFDASYGPLAQTFPEDLFFGYRRERSISRTNAWGPGGFLNQTLKHDSTLGVVDNQNDMYAIIQRGNSTDGYDVILQRVGTACPSSAAEGSMPISDCKSSTKSNLALLILRPIGPQMTVFKMNGRFVGQSYKARPDGESVIGFNAVKIRYGDDKDLDENIEGGQYELNRLAQQLDDNLDLLRNAGDVTHATSEKGYYLKAGGRSQKIEKPATIPDSKTHALLYDYMNWFLVDGASVQMVTGKGHQMYGNVRYTEFTFKAE